MTTAPAVPVTIRGRFPVRRAILGLLALIALGGFAIYRRIDPITPANFRRIRPGMTGDAVRSILGRPDVEWPAVGKIGEGILSINPDPAVRRKEGHRSYLVRQWDRPRLTIDVVFDESGAVVCTYFLSTSPGDRTSMLGYLFRIFSFYFGF